MKSIKYWYRALAWMSILSIIGLGSACGGSNMIPITGNTISNTLILSGCYQIRFLGLSRDTEAATSTWRYQVDELPCAARQLSDWMISIPVCAAVVDASPAAWEVLLPDPVLQSNGVKWKMDEEFQGGEFSIKLTGVLLRGASLVGVKAPNEAVGLIQGPVCDPNAPTQTTTFTPSSSTPTATTTATATVRVTSSPVNTATVTRGPFIPVIPTDTDDPRPAPTRRATSAPTNTPTLGATQTASTPEPTEVTPEPTQAEPTQPSSLPTVIATLIPTDVISTLTSQSETGAETISITENDEILTYSCNGDAVEISGNVNVVNLVGECSSITVTGNNNRVYWEEGAPVVEDTGSDNTIDQQ